MKPSTKEKSLKIHGIEFPNKVDSRKAFVNFIIRNRAVNSIIE